MLGPSQLALKQSRCNDLLARLLGFPKRYRAGRVLAYGIA